MGPADESAIYGDLMRFKPDGLTANGWAVRAGVSRTVWADMRRHGNPSRRTLEKLLIAAGSSLAEFEALRVGDQPGRTSTGASRAVAEARRRGWAGAPLPPLPLVACFLAGEWGEAEKGVELMEVRPDEPTDWVSRPESLAGDKDAYALTVVGDSMWPRFRPGRRVAVSPRAPVAIGDDVLVRLRGTADDAGGVPALLTALVKRTANRIELRQFNPDVTFSVQASEVEALHRVLGELI